MLVFWWCFCGGVVVGGVFVVVLEWYWSDAFVIMFFWWCFCGGVFVVVFLWWCFCGVVV